MAQGRGGFFFFLGGVAAAWEDLGSRQQPKPDLNLGDTQVREFRPGCLARTFTTFFQFSMQTITHLVKILRESLECSNSYFLKVFYI